MRVLQARQNLRDSLDLGVFFAVGAGVELCDRLGLTRENARVLAENARLLFRHPLAYSLAWYMQRAEDRAFSRMDPYEAEDRRRVLEERSYLL